MVLWNNQPSYDSFKPMNFYVLLNWKRFHCYVVFCGLMCVMIRMSVNMTGISWMLLGERKS